MVPVSPFFKKDVKILEDVQRRATKMMSGLHELPYPTRPCKLKLSTLVYRRRQSDAILVHKLINSKALPDLLPLVPQDSCTRGHNLQLSRHFSSKQQHTHILTIYVANLWNKLLPDTIAAQTTDSFKNHLDNKWSTKEWKYNWEALKSATSNNLPSVPIQLCVMYYQLWSFYKEKPLDCSKLQFKIILRYLR